MRPPILGERIAILARGHIRILEERAVIFAQIVTDGLIGTRRQLVGGHMLDTRLLYAHIHDVRGEIRKGQVAEHRAHQQQHAYHHRGFVRAKIAEHLHERLIDRTLMSPPPR